MNPQQRLFLECCWEALERAGYAASHTPGAVGVFAGASLNRYLLDIFADQDLSAAGGRSQLLIGNSSDYLATRVSYKLNLRGPSFGVQTACSTSLVAVHLACQSLRLGECTMALAGGVSIRPPQQEDLLDQESGLISPDGHCRAFDAQAQGTVFGSGVGVVVLKRLADALADGDQIYAVIKGSAITNDGAAKVGFTAPSVDGQAAAIRQAIAAAGVDPATIGYVEAHGTGTPLGDPIEVAALTQAYRAWTDRTGFCALGTLKPNVGHLDAAAGVAGLLKAVLALAHCQLPPTLHVEQPNQQIDFARSPFYLNTALAEWPAGQTPRRAAVSSFGFGGTNAHVILEEAPRGAPPAPARPWNLLLLSAKTGTALEAATAGLAEHLRQCPDLDMDAAAYTLQVGRDAWSHRRALVYRDRAEALEVLEGEGSARLLTAVANGRDRPVVFLFPGQGAQYVNMGQDLYRHEPIFREWIDRCAEILRPHLGLDVREVIYSDRRPPTASNLQSPINETQYTQPALFVVEYALAQLWMSWGVRPAALIGHSVGEYVAACLAGVFSLEDALELVALRGRLMQALPRGSMLTVPLAEAELRRALEAARQEGIGPLDLAALNGPAHAVVAGSHEMIAAFAAWLDGRGVVCRTLQTSHAFHSWMVEPVVEPFTEQVRRVELRASQLPYISNVSGDWITPTEATDPAYWGRHLRQPVRFGPGVLRLLAGSESILLEVGPGQTLSTLARAAATERVIIASMRPAKETQPDLAYLLGAAGKLWLAGCPIDWSGLYGHERRRRIALPTYPFERQRYWIEPRRPAARRASGKRPDVADWFYLPSWQRSVPPKPQPLGERHTALVFADERGLGAALVERLRDERCPVVRVYAGERFSTIEPGTYTIDPARPDDYVALLDALGAADQPIDLIVHCWSVGAGGRAHTEIERFDRAQTHGLYSLLLLAQALGQRENAGPIRISVVANSLHDVIGTESLRPEQATILGACKVIPQEYPNLACQCIDVVLPESPALPAGSLIDQIWAEVGAGGDAPLVAYRGHHRWVQTFEALRVEPQPAPDTPLREGGVYLITGGLGGMGMVLAQHLARAARARLILTGRSALPARADWPGWLATHDAQDGVSRKIRDVLALEELGAEVLVVAADVADLEQMRAAVRQGTERFGPIHGAIHAAGVAGGGLIQLKTPAIAERVLAPKARGALVLDTLLADQPLDFLVLCSSISSITGRLGQADYAAANAFLDSFAFQRRGRRGSTVSINWDTWCDTGMARTTPVPLSMRRIHEQAIEHGISSTEGVEVFSRILALATAPQVIVSTRDLQATIAEVRAFTRSEALETIERAQETRPAHTRAHLSTSYVAPETELEQIIAEVWQEVIGVERVGVHDNFFELGGHSLLGMQLVSRLRDGFAIDIPVGLLFEAPTVADLALAIESLLIAEIEALPASPQGTTT